jgi:hypothetical protein
MQYASNEIVKTNTLKNMLENPINKPPHVNRVWLKLSAGQMISLE